MIPLATKIASNAGENRNRKGKHQNSFEIEELFGRQFHSNLELGRPDDQLVMLAKGAIEVIAGSRDINQLSPWLSEDLFLRLRERASAASRQRGVKGDRPSRPSFELASLSYQSPQDGVVEAVVLLRGITRVRAVTVRLEGYNSRWRAVNLSVL